VKREAEAKGWWGDTRANYVGPALHRGKNATPGRQSKRKYRPGFRSTDTKKKGGDVKTEKIRKTSNPMEVVR